jgi:ankyrin repeat protein
MRKNNIFKKIGNSNIIIYILLTIVGLIFQCQTASPQRDFETGLLIKDETLIDKSIPNLEPNIPDEKGYTPIYYAGSSCHLKSLRLLLDKGGDFYNVGKNANLLEIISNMYSTMPEECDQVIDYLIEKKFDVNKKFLVGDRQMSVMQTAGIIWSNEHVNLIKKLIAAGGDVNANPGEGVACSSLLHAAVMNDNVDIGIGFKKKNTEVIKLLIKSKADTKKKCNGFTPYGFAKYQNYLNTMKPFEEMGVKN